MATSTVNNNLKGVISSSGMAQHDSVPINDSTSPFNQGDLLYWDQVLKIAKPVVDDSTAATLLGVALEPSKITSNVDNKVISAKDVTVGYATIVNLKTTVLEVYNNGDLVYVGSDAQTATKAAGQYPVGVVRLLADQEPLTGGVSVLVPVLIYSRAFANFSEYGFAPTPPGSENNLYVDVENGSDTAGTGSLTNPYKTIAKAQSTITDAAISTPLGPQKNLARNYSIILAPGVYSEDPSWEPIQYVNYIGAGSNLTTVQHSDSSTIVLNYGDNYGFVSNIQGMTLQSFNLTRTPGFTDPTNLPTFTAYNFIDVEFLGGSVFTGSGYDAGFPLFVGDVLGFFHCGGDPITAHAIQTVIAGSGNVSPFSNITWDYSGSDGGVPIDGGYIHSISNSGARRLDLHDYVTVNLFNMRKTNIRLFGRTNNPFFQNSYGPTPTFFADCDSQQNNVNFRTTALPDQQQFANSIASVSSSFRGAMVTSSPYVSYSDQEIFTNLSVAGPVAVTLASGTLQGRQEVIDYKGDAGTNNITVTAARFDLINKGGVIGTSTTISSNYGHLEFLYTSDGAGGGSSQVGDIVTVADVAGSLNSKYFVLSVLSAIQEPLKFAVWFNVNGAGVPPVVAGAQLVEVSIPTNATAAAVATALLAALQVANTILDPGTYQDSEPVTSTEISCTNFVPGVCPGPVDGTAPTGFTLSVTTPGTDQVNGTFIAI